MTHYKPICRHAHCIQLCIDQSFYTDEIRLCFIHVEQRGLLNSSIHARRLALKKETIDCLLLLGGLISSQGLLMRMRILGLAMRGPQLEGRWRESAARCRLL